MMLLLIYLLIALVVIFIINIDSIIIQSKNLVNAFIQVDFI